MRDSKGHLGTMVDMTREPSMEEILSSIRRVIARDEGRRDAFAAALDADEVLDLNDVHEAPTDAVAANASPQTSDVPSDAAADDALLSQISASASRQSLSALSAALAGHEYVATSTAGITSGDVTLNALVEAMLRPMLREWLDTNLPTIVERLVAREITRITGGDR